MGAGPPFAWLLCVGSFSRHSRVSDCSARQPEIAARGLSCPVRELAWPKRRWTVVFVPHGSEPSRIVEVSYGLIKMAVGGVALGLVVGAAGRLRHHVAPDRRSVASTRLAAGERAAGTGDRRAPRPPRPRSPIPSPASASATPGSGCSPTSSRSIPRSRPPASAGPSLAPRPLLPTEDRRAPAVARDPGRPQRADPPRQPAGLVLRRGRRQPGHATPQRLAATPSIMPTQGWLTSAFSSMREHPILHIARPHEGIDVTAPMGSPIEAPAAGVVTDAGWETGYGNTVTIDHGYGIVTKFAHASKLLVHDRPAGLPGPAHRAGRQHRPRHRPAPALRGARERPAGGSAQVRVAGSCGDGLSGRRTGRKRRRTAPDAASRAVVVAVRPPARFPASPPVRLELHLRRLRRSRRRLEVLPRLAQAENLGGQVVGKAADVGVVLARPPRCSPAGPRRSGSRCPRAGPGAA